MISKLKDSAMSIVFYGSWAMLFAFIIYTANKTELDSLIDFINFGVAPAITVYIWILKDLGNAGWLLVLFHSVACCLRLARFNLGSKIINEKWRENFFTGVPSPAGAGILLLPLILSLSDLSSNYDYKKLAIIFIISSTFLMISKIPTYSLKGIKVSRPFLIFLLLLIAVYFGFLINYPFNTLLATGCFYLSLIPISFVHFKNIKIFSICRLHLVAISRI